MAVADQSPAAVVRPFTSAVLRPLRMVPAQRKPMPAAMPWITRLMASCPAPSCSMDMTKSAEPRHTSIWVRIPAALPITSRS
ncbi:hypothetical protein D3C81_1676030 [compost metagenome]